MNKKFNSTTISTLLKNKMQTEGLSEREVARRTGLSNTTINSALKGQILNNNSLLCISEFLHVPPSSLLDSYLSDLDNGQAIVASFVQYICHHPQLAEIVNDLAQQVREGKDIFPILVEALHYAAYRLGIPLEQKQT